jgi:hypothetical protein
MVVAWLPKHGHAQANTTAKAQLVRTVRSLVPLLASLVAFDPRGMLSVDSPSVRRTSIIPKR